ncbi:restriction endonuclease subunit S [Pseudomonas saudiphocaensis]|uniref:Type I restriction-modification system, S subunit n=1 Tax=Pseudomonas saudiphocaensis TaxID=1499686 RepID=A0A078LWF7_9PSED|nr:restriction endonuclease subunit S [Pseudomonas saudiphocaensis]CDZ95590.1 type I restriction-modification system, S subunit [Pseudomonas saudiphocaensis]
MSMEAPANWLPASFDDVFAQISTSGKKVKTADVLVKGKFPVVDQGRKFITGYLDDAHLVVADDKPLIIFGDHTREVKWINFSFIPGADGVQVLKPHPEMDGRFLYFFLRNLPIESKGYARHFKIVKDATYLVPPLAEQTRIAAKLDELLAQVDTLKARIDGIPALLKRFRQSVLAAAVSGRLTEEWRAQHPGEIDQEELIQARRLTLGSKESSCTAPGGICDGPAEIPGGWIGCEFDLLCEIKHGYAFESEFFSDSGPIVLTPGNFTESGLLDFKKKRVVRLEGEFEQKWVLNNGDILVVMTDLSPKKLILGKAVCLTSNDVVLHNQRIGKVVPFSKQVSKDFLRLALLAPKTKQIVDETATGTVVQHTSPKKILAIPTLLPPLAEQTEIVRRVEQLFSFADQLENKVNSAKIRIDHLTQSILAKAFRGELVPQDPNDEHASLLLERIKAQRAAAPKAKRGRKASA